MDEPKRTYVTPDESVLQYERPGFQPVCTYGSIIPEDGEIGGIFEPIGEPAPHESGVFVQSAICLERVFLCSENNDNGGGK